MNIKFAKSLYIGIKAHFVFFVFVWDYLYVLQKCVLILCQISQM